MVRRLPLSQGKFTKLDEEDFVQFSGQRWSADGPRKNNKYYVVGTINGKKTYLHRAIMGCPKDHIDHIDGDPLNNTRANLRRCNAMQNGHNRANRKGGVTFDKQRPKTPWAARVQVMYRTINLGRFATKVEAVKARKAGEIKYFGVFAPHQRN